MTGRAPGLSRSCPHRASCRSAVRAAVLWLALSSSLPRLASAQAADDPGWQVVSVRLTADVTAGDGSAAVTVTYALTGTPRGALLPMDLPIRFTLLELGEASVARFSVNGGPPVELSTTQGRQRAADISFPPAGGGRELVLELTYGVEDAVVFGGEELRARIPVLAGPSAPDPGPGGGFEARVIVPSRWRIAEGFPSGLRSDGAGVLTAALQVTPAFVGFRARSDGAWRPGLPLIVDLIMLVILGTFAALGMRHLRGVVA